MIFFRNTENRLFSRSFIIFYCKNEYFSFIFIVFQNGERVWLNSTTGDLIDAMFIPPDSSADAER